MERLNESSETVQKIGTGPYGTSPYNDGVMKTKPIVLASKCLSSAKCRWNGERISDKLVKKLKSRVDFIFICPEMAIGLGVPREPITILILKGSLRLIQPSIKRDLTKEMKKFTSNYLSSLKKVDGFILKHRSPSCGVKGFFGKEVLKRFPDVPIETDKRLASPKIQKQFIDKLFT